MELVRRQGMGMMRLSREAKRELASVQADGMATAERVTAAAFVSQMALNHAGLLSEAEAQLIERNPLGEGRYKAIVDSFAGVACAEITRIGMR